MMDHFDIIPAEVAPVETTLEGTTAPAPIKMDVSEETGEENPQFVYSDEEDEKDDIDLDDIELPDMPVKRAKLQDVDVFAPKVEAVKSVVKPKKERKKRKPMTPLQLEKLAEGRKKAFAVKAANKKARDELRSLEKKVQLKKKAKQHQEIMDELSDDEIPESFKTARATKVVVEKEKVVDLRSRQAPSNITHDDLMKAMAQASQNAVETYDRQRKAEKKIKKEKLAAEQRQTDNVRKITGAMNLGSSPWDQFLR